ncbi:MAG TPA: acyl-CoA dehydrogenase family protein [Acidimicrobiales bacterium]|nr:acyl-CoA dehydrogenase family protein [Acidimicrobiales bacterium]
MDFAFTETQEDLQALARRILEAEVTEERLREAEAGADRFDPRTWDALAKANLLGIALPESCGGSGYGVLEQCLVLEEIGRTVAPVPVLASIVLGAMAIGAFGTDAQRARYAVPAATGEMILTAALVEPGNPEPEDVQTRATPVESGGWLLDGTKTCVPAVTLAGRVLVPAGSADGVVVAIVDPAAPGVTVIPQATTNRDREGLLELREVRVAPDDVLAGPADGAEVLRWILQRATVGLCALQLGITEKALRMTAEYTSTRIQFDRPLAHFQAVGQRAADAFVDVEGIRLTMWQAAYRLDEGLPADTEVEVAKFWAADGGHRVAHAAAHLHGGVGVDVDYPLHRYFLWAKKVELTLGGSTQQLLRIGRHLAAEAV